MKTLPWIGFIILFAFSAHAQNNWKYDDYKKYSHKTFRNLDIFSETIDFENPDYPRLHAAIFYLTNEIRDKRNLPILEFNKNLEVSAWNHSRRMVEKDFFNHVDHFDKKRREPNDRAVYAGISNPYLAENIAETSGLQYKSGTEIFILDKTNAKFSYTDNGPVIPPHTYLSFAETLVDQWMHSKPHKKNILSKEALQLGCGSYLFYDKRFYNMPSFRSTQNFQWFKEVESGQIKDPMPE